MVDFGRGSHYGALEDLVSAKAHTRTMSALRAPSSAKKRRLSRPVWVEAEKYRTIISDGNLANFGNLPFSSGVRANNYPPEWQDRQLNNLSQPLWAVQSVYDFNENTGMSRAIYGFYEDARRQMDQGTPASAIMGSQAYPRIDILFNKNLFEEADSMSRWAAGIANMIKEEPNMEQVISMWISWLLMRWMLISTPEHYEAIPEWLRPTPRQLFVPHAIFSDFLIWPTFREVLVEQTHMQTDQSWLDEVARTISVNWDKSVREGLTIDESTGQMVLSPGLTRHMGNMHNWTVGSRFRMFMPNADHYLRIKYQPERDWLNS